jgi:hypothetical protein
MLYRRISPLVFKYSKKVDGQRNKKSLVFLGGNDIKLLNSFHKKRTNESEKEKFTKPN